MLPEADTDWLTLVDAVKRFEKASRQTPGTGIDDFLPPNAPLRGRVLVELVHVDLELRLKAGENIRVEGYLDRYPELTNDRDVVLELITAEHALRQPHEPGLTCEEYVRRFPQYHAEMVQRGWLTPFQLQEIEQGRGHALAFGQYRLLDRLGEGGMGVVFKARHVLLDRVVALKQIRRECLEDPEVVKRFHREMQAAARLDHPNIVHAHDADEVDGIHFYIMEYVEGIDLHRLLQEQGPLPVRQACDCIRQAALGLQHAHEKNLVHRDIKPHNLLLARNGTVKVLDLGLARIHASVEASTLTREDHLIGTLDYVSPEQATNSHTVDIRGDLYSLGCTFYQLLSGQVPFPGGSAMEKLSRHGFQAPRPIEELRPDVPPAVAAVVRKLLAKKPIDRFQTPTELADALASILQMCEPAIALTANSGIVPNWPPEVSATSDTVAVAPKGVGPASRPRWFRRRSVLAMVLLVLSALIGALLWRELTPEPPPLAIAPFDARQAREFQRLWAEYLNVNVDETNSLGMRLTLIPPGKFIMGSPDGERARQPHEGPMHEVAITQAFFMGTCEVTVHQYGEYLKDTGQKLAEPLINAPTGDYPMAQVNWFEAVAFCRWLSQKEGKSYALPTEAQWEYACRAGSQALFSFGDDDRQLADYSWYTINANSRTHPVGQKQPNSWGLRDMYGNVWEWVQDWYQADYYRESPSQDPPGPRTGTNRVLRGGGWNRDLLYVRSAARYGEDPPSIREQNVGFRVVLRR